MQEGARRHAELVAELAEWQEDLWQRHTGSRVVLVQVPAGWGRTTVLDQFEAQIAARVDAPVAIAVRIGGQNLPGEAALQAQALRNLLAPAVERHRAAKLLGLDRAGGAVLLGLGVGGLFFSGVTAGLSFLVAGLAVGAAGKAWDDSPAGQDGALARAARAVAAVSVAVPVVVILDDADSVDPGLAVTLAENLAARHDGQVLIIAVVNPGSSLAAALTDRSRFGLTEGLVHAAEADPDMGYQSRLDLARQLCPHLRDAAVRRIAQRTATFAEVFRVAAAPRLAELGQGDGGVLAVVDAAVDARLARLVPSREAAVLAWAGGLAHARQAERAMGILGTPRFDDDPDVRRWAALVRLVDPASPRLAAQVAADLKSGERRAMAAAFLDEALTITRASGTSVVDRVIALQAAHRVRADLPAPGRLPRAQAELVAALETLGDHAAALQVTTEALAGWPPGDQDQGERQALAAAALRLSRLTPQGSAGPLAEQLIAEAKAAGAAVGLEARIWAAITLLDTPDQREAALTLAGRVMADLDARPDLGEPGDRWRLLLAYHTARAGCADIAGQLLAPLLASDDPARHRPARAVLDAGDGPRADIRLQNILLANELAALPAGAEDDRLRLHHALAANHATLGNYRQALAHGQHELALRSRIQGPDHPATLTTRANTALWTGKCGNAAEALALNRDLLPDMERVLGPDHLGTLATRSGIAYSTGECGNAARALALFQDLLPDMERVLGPRHPNMLATRANIAFWTGRYGNAAAALALHRGLLPDRERVLGPDHPDTLMTRISIATWTGQCEDAAAALALYQNLLPDVERVLGPGHPETLATRGNIAGWTGECGDSDAALALYRGVLPDLEQVLGPQHPAILNVHAQIARLARESDAAAGS